MRAAGSSAAQVAELPGQQPQNFTRQAAAQRALTTGSTHATVSFDFRAAGEQTRLSSYSLKSSFVVCPAGKSDR
jgi:hypothetical protein